MGTQVTMEDGTESPLVDHMRDAHQKGTQGFTEEYLASLHRTLHQRQREPEEELEHTHLEAFDGDAGAAEVDEDQPISGVTKRRGKHRKT